MENLKMGEDQYTNAFGNSILFVYHDPFALSSLQLFTMPNCHFFYKIFGALCLTNFDHLFEHLLRDVLTIEEFVTSIESPKNGPKEVEDDHKLCNCVRNSSGM